jgi:hypothetical protein
MQQLSLDLPPTTPALSRWACATPVAPPSAAVIEAIVAFGDLRSEREDGTVSIRISPARLAQPDMEARLGLQRFRALDVSVVWDEDEAEIVRVVDVRPVRPPAGPGPTGNRYADARMRGFPRLRPEPPRYEAAA